MATQNLTPLRQAALLLTLGAVSLSASGQVLEEVVVTAQKRVESLADVPISVNVMSGEKISQQGITNLNDLSDFVPNLSMNQTGIGTNITIRGISSGINPAFEQSVGMYVDDIYYGRPQLARVPYLDLDRVEVLRGPQPILFGKNSIAGAISAITKRASVEEMEGFVQADLNFDQGGADFQGAVNIPMGDKFAVRLSGLLRDQDGYYENTTLGRDESELEQDILRLALTFEPTDTLSINLKAERTTFDTSGRFLEIINPVEQNGSFSYAQTLAALTGGAVQLDTEQDFRRQATGDIEETEVDSYMLNIDWDLGGHTLTSITGALEYDYYQQCDCDFVDAVLIDTAGEETFEQFSQEFRLTSPGDQVVDYIVGAFYQTYDVTVDDITIVPTNSLLAGLSTAILGTGARRDYDTDSDLWSVFAQVTWNISDTMRLTLGGRYSDEDKSGARRIEVVDIVESSPVRDVLGQPISASGGAAATYFLGFRIENEQNPLNGSPFDPDGHNVSGSRGETSFTPALNFQWDYSDQGMAYFAYTEGFKAGGFDTRANNSASFEFDEEEATAYELGVKMGLGDSAELNAALYLTEYKELQTSQFDGVLGFNVTNAGEATIQGFELDGRWQVTDSLLLVGSAGWLDFEWDEFPNSQCAFGETPNSAAFPGLCDRQGQTREFAPELTANIGFTYTAALNDSTEFSFSMDAAYSDDYFVAPTLTENLVQGSYTKFNARLGLAGMNGNWDVALVVENLTDEAILTFGSQGPVAATLVNAFNEAVFGAGQGRDIGRQATAYYAFYEAPRNVALQFRYSF